MKLRSIKAIFILMFITCLSSAAQEKIVLYEFREPFFYIPFQVDTVVAERSFIYNHQSEETEVLYFDYGPYRCYFYASSGKSYRIYIPDSSLFKQQWKNDQYFNLLPLHVKTDLHGVASSDTGLNHAIRKFDNEFEPFLSRQTLRYFQPDHAKVRLDSFIEVNYSNQPTDSGYFYQYKRYRKAILLYHLNQQNLDTLIHEFLESEPVRIEIPSYRTFFSLIMANYFEFLQRKEEFRNIYSEFSRFSPEAMKEYLRKNQLLKNDTILELVLLKEYYNAFYADKLDKRKLVAFTDSIYQTTRIEIVRKTASVLNEKFTRLRQGYRAPVFSAKTLAGDSVILSGTYDKLIYIGFCDLSKIQCLQEIEYVKYLSRKHGKFMRIITILKSPSPQILKELSEEANENWVIINWNSHESLGPLFDVQAAPAFYLIDRDGKILRNPAPNPSENFETVLFNILREKGEV